MREKEIADAIKHELRETKARLNKALKDENADRIYVERLLSSAKKAYGNANVEAKRVAKKDGYGNSEQEERLFWKLFDEHLNETEDDPLQALLKWQHALRPGNAWYATWHDAIEPPVRPDPDRRQRKPPYCATGRQPRKRKSAAAAPAPPSKRQRAIQDPGTDEEDAGEEEYHCHCGDPDDAGDMIECEGAECSGWVHISCKGLTKKEVRTYDDIEYTCTQCAAELVPLIAKILTLHI